MHCRIVLYVPVLLLVLIGLSCAESDQTMYGRWQLNQEESTDLVAWRYRQHELEIRDNQGEVTILERWIYRKSPAFVDSVTFMPGDDPNYIVLKTPHWPGNWYMGALSQEGSKKSVAGEWKEKHRILRVVTEQELQTSQGEIILNTGREYRLESHGEKLIVHEKRSTRPTPIILVFERQPNK